MKRVETVIRILAGIVLGISIVIIAILSVIRSQRDSLPKILDRYIAIMEDSSMAPAAGQGALVVLKEENPFKVGDIAAFLNDSNRTEISRIVSVNGNTEGVEVVVPFEEMKNALGSPNLTQQSVMADDPMVEMKKDNEVQTETVAADRLMAKAVFISNTWGVFLSMYSNTVWAVLIVAVSAVICIWPFRHSRKEPEYEDQDLDGPWMG